MRLKSALFRLAFATATPHGLTSPHATNSQAHSSEGTPSPHPQGAQLRRIVGTRFQVLFHSPPGVLFTFPSRYSSAIGHQEVFRLTRWSWQIHGRLQGSAATREHTKQVRNFHLPDYHRLRCRFPTASTSNLVLSLPDRLVDQSTNVPQPRTRNPCQVSHVPGLASSAFARHY